MDLIQHPTAVGNQFVEEDPGNGIEATVITAAHLNAVQNELVNVIAGAGLTPDAGDETQLLEAIQGIGGTGNARNLAINGGFRVSQRGDTFDLAAVPTYTLDRWEAAGDSTGGAGTCRVRRMPFDFGQASVPGAAHYLRFEQLVTPTAGGGFVRTKLEELLATSDRVVTVSFWARAGAAATISVAADQVLAGSSNLATPVDVTLTTGWLRYSASFTLASLVGATADAQSHLRIAFAMPTGAGSVVEIANVKVEAAANASDYEERDLSLEYALCRRYFEKSAPIESTQRWAAAGQAVGYGDPDGGFFVRTMERAFAVPKRALPTVTYYTSSGLAGNVLRDGSVTVGSVVTDIEGVSSNSTGFPRLLNQVFDDTRCEASWTADAEL
jgi:hypothetical protein